MRCRPHALRSVHARVGSAAAARDFLPPAGTSPQHGTDYLAQYGLTHLHLGAVGAEALQDFARRADLAVHLVLRHARTRAGYAWRQVPDAVLLPSLRLTVRAWRRTRASRLSDAFNALVELASELARTELTATLTREWALAARALRFSAVERTRLNEVRGLQAMDGTPARGARILERMLAARRRLLGDEDSLTVEGAITVGRCLASVGRLTRARQYLSHAAVLRERACGPLHYLTLLARYEAFALMAREAPLVERSLLPPEAAAHGEALLEDITRGLGTTNLLCATTFSTLGVCLAHAGNYHVDDPEARERSFARARECFDAARALRERLGCAHGSDWLVVLGNQVWLQDCWHPEAVEANLAGYAEVIARYEEAFGPDVPGSEYLWVGIGNIHLRCANHAEAGAAYARVARTRAQRSGADAPTRWEAELCVARCDLHLGKLDAVAHVVDAVLARVDAMQEDGQVRIVSCLYDLGQRAAAGGALDIARTCLRGAARTEETLYTSPHSAAVSLATLAELLREAGASDALETAHAALRADADDPDLEGIAELCAAFGIEG